MSVALAAQCRQQVVPILQNDSGHPNFTAVNVTDCNVGHANVHGDLSKKVVPILQNVTDCNVGHANVHGDLSKKTRARTQLLNDRGVTH